MLLTDIKQYIAERKQASLMQIASFFSLEPAVAKDMLSHWIRKGRICCKPQTSACGTSCHKCELSLIEIYHWVD